MPPQKPHAWNKTSNTQCKISFPQQRRNQGASLHMGKIPHTKVLSEDSGPKKTPKYYGWTHPCGNPNFKGHFHPWENRFLSSYSTIIIWQLKIVICFRSGIYHVSCALNPQLKISRCHVCTGHVRSKWYYWLLSLSHSLPRICFIEAESRSQRHYKVYIPNRL